MKVGKYLDIRGLSLSANKTVLLQTTTSRKVPKVKVSFNGAEISNVKHHKFLGIIIDENLNWKQEIELLTKGASIVHNAIRVVKGNKNGVCAERLVRLVNAITLSRFMYALPLMTNIKPNDIKYLETILIKQYRLCLGLLHNTPRSAVLAEAGVKPLSLMIKEHFMCYINSLRSLFSSHGLLDKLKNRCLTDLYPILEEVVSISGTDDTKNNLNKGYQFWSLPEFPILLNVKGLKGSKLDVHQGVIQKLFRLQMNELWKNYTTVYTDGSTTDSTSSCSVVFFDSKVTSSGLLPHRSSSTKAELVGIREALKMIKDNSCGNFVICSDSKSALQSLKLPPGKTSHPQLIWQIQQELGILLNKGFHIGFQWTPSHCGIEGNEEADKLASNASSQDYVFKDVFTEAQEKKSLCKSYIAKQAQAAWETEHDRFFVAHCKERPTKMRKIKTTSRVLASKIRRLRVGKAMTNSTKFLFKFSDSPNCETCNIVEDVEHLLMHCKDFDAERQHMQDILETDGQEFSLSTILHESNLQHLINFVLSSNLANRL